MSVVGTAAGDALGVQAPSRVGSVALRLLLPTATFAAALPAFTPA